MLVGEAFKDAFNDELIDGISLHLSRAWPDFDGDRFERLAKDVLGDPRAQGSCGSDRQSAARHPAPERDHEPQGLHAIRPISTRRYYGGRHRVEVVANGSTLAGGDFELEM